MSKSNRVFGNISLPKALSSHLKSQGELSKPNDQVARVFGNISSPKSLTAHLKAQVDHQK